MKYKLLPLFPVLIISDIFGTYTTPKPGVYNMYETLSTAPVKAVTKKEDRKLIDKVSKISSDDSDTDDGWEIAGRRKHENDDEFFDAEENMAAVAEENLMPVIRDPILMTTPQVTKPEDAELPQESTTTQTDAQQISLPTIAEDIVREGGRDHGYHAYRQYHRRGRGGRRPSYRIFDNPYHHARGGVWNRPYRSRPVSQAPSRANEWRKAFQELNQVRKDLHKLHKGANYVRVVDSENRIYESVWHPDKTAAPKDDKVGDKTAEVQKPFPFKATPPIKH